MCGFVSISPYSEDFVLWVKNKVSNSVGMKISEVNHAAETCLRWAHQHTSKIE